MLIRTTALALVALTAIAGAASAQSRNITSNYGFNPHSTPVAARTVSAIKSFPETGRAANVTSNYGAAESNPLPDLRKIPQFANNHGVAPAGRR